MQGRNLTSTLDPRTRRPGGRRVDAARIRLQPSLFGYRAICLLRSVAVLATTIEPCPRGSLEPSKTDSEGRRPDASERACRSTAASCFSSRVTFAVHCTPLHSPMPDTVSRVHLTNRMLGDERADTIATEGCGSRKGDPERALGLIGAPSRGTEPWHRVGTERARQLRLGASVETPRVHRRTT